MASRKEGSGNIDGIHWINQFWVVVLNIFILWDLWPEVSLGSTTPPFLDLRVCGSVHRKCILRVLHGKKGCSFPPLQANWGVFSTEKRRVSRKRIWIFPAALTNSHSRVDITPNNFNRFSKQRNKILTTLVLPFYQRASCIIGIRWIHLQLRNSSSQYFVEGITFSKSSFVVP